MAGVARAVGRLLIMAGVMAAVLVTGLLAGVGTTIAVALAIVLAGLVGLVGVARRRPDSRGRAEPVPTPVASAEVEPTAPHPTAPHAVLGQSAGAAVAAMNPATAGDVDPESLMPRWRRPSLIQARRADPLREPSQSATPQRFDGRRSEADLRIVRYAVVPVMDRPDELQGMRLGDLSAGDEVEVIDDSGTYLQVASPTGVRGWIHRTTVSPPSTAYLAPRFADEPGADDALTALLVARGLQ